jgi:membrane protein implicated in regulation of membrane protease activity
VNSAAEILLFLIGVSFGLFVLISLLVLLPGRSAQRRVESGPVWLGGPSRSEHGVSTSGLVLADRVAHWADVPEHDWVAAAETAEPGRHVGGASAGW